MRTSLPNRNSMGVSVEASPDATCLGLRKLFGESLPHDELPEHTHSSPTRGSYCTESASEVCASTQNNSKVIETENIVGVFRRIVENLEVLFPNSPLSPIDNYKKIVGTTKVQH